MIRILDKANKFRRHPGIRTNESILYVYIYVYTMYRIGKKKSIFGVLTVDNFESWREFTPLTDKDANPIKNIFHPGVWYAPGGVYI